MDRRAPLVNGISIVLGDITYVIEKLMGFGANAFVYLASYEDNLQRDKRHTVLVKELFPYHPKGLIYRTGSGSICFTGEAEEYFNLHKKSFLHGNACHLDIQNIDGHMASVNINSFEKNGTLYTVLGNSNGETLLDAARKGTAVSSLSGVVSCMLGILDALEVFHQNNLLHLDISPDNILLMPYDKNDGQYRTMMLIDYNSAWNIGELAENQNVYFSVKEHYSAPEVRLQDKDSISFASDLFSVCALFLEYLQGRPMDFSALYSGGKIHGFDAGLLADAPATAAAKASSIVKKGLRLPPRQRYQSIGELRADFIELRDRIKGVGITHSSLWEASRANFQSYVQGHERYRYLFQDGALLPCSVRLNGTKCCSLHDAVDFLSEGGPSHVQISGGGGMGKTTALMLLWKDGISSYNPRSAVPVYIPLYNYNTSSIPYIKGCMLERLKFDDRTTTVEDALRALDCLLGTEAKGRHSVLLLLDGLNEVAKDSRPLFLEIHELMKKSGVQIILASRVKDVRLSLNTLEILPLTEYEIKCYLNNHSVLYPVHKALQDIITSPMMLSVYTSACRNGQRAVDVNSVDALLDEYINSLMSAHMEHTMCSEQEQLKAQYALQFLLPAIAHRMKKLKTCVLSANEVCKAVRNCFRMLAQKSFLRCFPQYMGRSKLIKGGAKTPEEWFNDAVYIMLCSKFALLYYDGNGNYMLPHQNFYDYFIRKHSINAVKLNAAKKRLALPYMAATLAAVAAVAFAAVKVSETIPVSYPETVQEKGIVENAMAVLADSLGRLGLQIKNDTAVLDSYSNGYGEFITVYNRNRSINDTLILRERYTEDRVRLFVPPGSPVPAGALEDLLNGANDYNAWSHGMFESLNAVLSNDSRYPEKDRLLIIELYKQYLESYTNLCYIKMQLAILPLNDDGRKPILNELPYMAVFGDKFLSQPFINNRAELESALKTENVRIQDISAKLKSYGMRG